MKFSIETLIEEVHCVVLESDEFESHKNHTIMQFLEFAAVQDSIDSKKLDVSPSKPVHILKHVDSHFDEKMQTVAQENISSKTKKNHSFILILATHAYQSFHEKMRLEKEDLDNKSFCTKTNLLIKTLTEEILTAVLRETEFLYQDQKTNFTEYKFSAILAHQKFVAMNQMQCLAIKKIFRSRKLSIDTLMDEMPAVVLESKRIGSQVKLKTLWLLRSLKCLWKKFTTNANILTKTLK